MVEQAGAAPGDAETNVAAARAQFVSSLGRRLEALRLALATVEQNPRSAAQRDHLRRRIHAFGAAAGVLGFDRVFDAFREAEGALGRTALADDSDLAFVARTLDLVPSLVLGADVTVSRGRTPASTVPLERRAGSWPTSVLVFAAAPLVEALTQVGGAEGAALELERTEDPERAEQIVRIMAPDVAVVDADRRGARELMETLVYDPLLDPVRIIAIGTFDRPEAAATLVALGVARVLPKPVSPDALKRSVLEVSRERAGSVPRTEPIGDRTIETLTEHLAQELRRGLVEAVKAQSRGLTVSFGEGTDVLAAVWASVARVRELVTLRSGGAVRFDTTGPEGAVPLAPWMSDGEQRALAPGERRGREDVTLGGRTIVVADDDPAVAWFLSGLFRAAGAEVFEAHDGNRALDLVREKWPDLVVSDILMPGLDGFSLCREIKRDVVLADTPVILLSWKEDLLQRVRELGVEADGYLRKEATASVVVQRVREVLLPRARVEARMSASGEARGRLDGLTPRLVIELAAARVPNSRVNIRDAGFLYEAQIRGGRFRSVTRTGVDGRSETGERVLSALLGVRAGRFAIQPDSSECRADWQGDLRTVLAPAIARARAALAALSDLGAVGRIDIDVQAFEAYSVTSPESARDVVRRLCEGSSPESLLGSGVPVRLVESILADVVRHGAIRRIVGRDGAEMFPRGLAEAPNPRAHGGSPSLKIAAVSEKTDVALRAVPSPRVQTPPPPVPARKPLAPPAPIPTPAAVVAAVPAPAGTPPPGRIAPPRPVPSPTPPAPVAKAPMVSIGDPVRRLPLPAGKQESVEAKPEPAGVDVAAPTEAAPVLEGGDKPELASVPTFDAEQTFAALMSDSLIPPPPASEPQESDGVRPISGKLAPPTTAPAEPSPLEAALRALPAAGATPSAGAPPVEQRGPRMSPSGTLIAVTIGSGAHKATEPKAKSDPKAALAATLETPAMDLATAVVANISETPEPKEVVTRRSATPEPRAATPEHERSSDASPQASSSPNDVAPSDSGPVRPAQQVSATGTTASSSGATSSSPRGSSTPASSRSGAKLAPSARSPETAEPPQPAASDAPTGGDRFVRSVAVAVLAGTAVFGIVTLVRNRFVPEIVQPAPSSGAVPADKPAPAEPGASAVMAPAEPGPSAVMAPAEPSPPVPASAPAAQPGVWPVQDLELPPDVTVQPDRGLLEIEVAAPHSIYVDGVFIGRGPSRRIPLREGTHEVRVRGDGTDAVQSVEVRKARRVRLGTSKPE